MGQPPVRGVGTACVAGDNLERSHPAGCACSAGERTARALAGAECIAAAVPESGDVGGNDVFVTVDYMTNRLNTFNLTAALYSTLSNGNSGSTSHAVAQAQSVPAVTLDLAQANSIVKVMQAASNRYAQLLAVPSMTTTPAPVVPFASGTTLTFTAWGSRTLASPNMDDEDWKYIPVRRLALYIEQSLIQGLQWVVFEPNDDALWAQIRLSVNSFLQNLYVQGAFVGASPSQAYQCICDASTTTAEDMENGIVNILVLFAPVSPAEFIVISLQQMAGQPST